MIAIVIAGAVIAFCAYTASSTQRVHALLANVSGFQPVGDSKVGPDLEETALDGYGPDGQPRAYASWELVPHERGPFYRCKQCGFTRTTTYRYIRCSCTRPYREIAITEDEVAKRWGPTPDADASAIKREGT